MSSGSKFSIQTLETRFFLENLVSEQVVFFIKTGF